MNGFSIARLVDLPVAQSVLSEPTRRCCAPATWIKNLAFYSENPEAANVYLLEAYGDASMVEVSDLLFGLSRQHKWAIVIWTSDNPFDRSGLDGHLIFDIHGAANAPSCGYGFEPWVYGPHRIGSWMPAHKRGCLASFVGTMGTSPIRHFLKSEILSSRKDVLIEDFDWWATFTFGEAGHLQRLHQRQKYDASLSTSKFTLCPRGNGPSSKRRWEAGYFGSIPILVGDETHPWGLDYSSVTIQVHASPDEDPDLIAQRVVEAMEANLGRVDELQERLKHFLVDELDDHVLDGASHTANKLVLKIAHKNWQGPQLGFGPTCAHSDVSA